MQKIVYEYKYGKVGVDDVENLEEFDWSLGWVLRCAVEEWSKRESMKFG